MRVRELICDPLDVWVCRAELDEFKGCRMSLDVIASIKAKLGVDFPYWPSRNWTIGGRIIDRERIAVYWDVDEWVALWRAESSASGALHARGPVMAGPTALIAGMRCYVASKFGEEVPA